MLWSNAQEPPASFGLYVVSFDVFGMSHLPGHNTSTHLPVRQRPSGLHQVPGQNRTLSHLQTNFEVKIPFSGPGKNNWFNIHGVLWWSNILRGCYMDHFRGNFVIILFDLSQYVTIKEKKVPKLAKISH